MIVICQKNRPYQKFIPGLMTRAATQVLKSGALQQVCIADDAATEGEGNLQRLTVYPLSKVLALRQRADTLVGHPLLDLKSKEGGHGFIELPAYQIKKIKKWQAVGDFIGVRNYERKLAGKDNQVSRIHQSKMVKYGLLSEADITWLKGICDVSYHFIQEQEAKLDIKEPDTDPPPKPAAKRSHSKGRISRKARRQMEQEQKLYGGTEKIERRRL